MSKIGQDFHHLWENIHSVYERLKAHNTPKAPKPATPAEPMWRHMRTAPAHPKPILLLGRYTYTWDSVSKPFIFIGSAYRTDEVEILGWMPLPTTTVVSDA